MERKLVLPSVPHDKEFVKKSSINPGILPSQLLNADDKKKIMDNIDWWSQDADTNTLAQGNPMSVYPAI